MVRIRRFSLSNVPVIFSNSFPKSGTHLLIQVLKGFSLIGPAVDSGLPAIYTFNGRTGRERSISEILKDLKRLLPGDIAYGHLYSSPAIEEFLCQNIVASYFILRDPRDVVVSHVHYITEMEPNHIHHDYFKNELASFDERIRVSIQGRRIPNTRTVSGSETHDLAFPDIRSRFEPYMNWLERPEVLVLKFEDFINQLEVSIISVLNHALNRGFTLTCESHEAVNILKEGINPKASPTYRSGKVGGWREVFSEDHKLLFKKTAGDILIKLGYEKDQNW